MPALLENPSATVCVLTSSYCLPYPHLGSPHCNVPMPKEETVRPVFPSEAVSGADAASRHSMSGCERTSIVAGVVDMMLVTTGTVLCFTCSRLCFAAHPPATWMPWCLAGWPASAKGTSLQRTRLHALCSRDALAHKRPETNCNAAMSRSALHFLINFLA